MPMQDVDHLVAYLWDVHVWYRLRALFQQKQAHQTANAEQMGDAALRQVKTTSWSVEEHPEQKATTSE